MRGFPTIIVLGADGVELDRQVGFGGDAEEFVTTIKDWAQNQNTLFASMQEWEKDTTNVEWNYKIAMRYSNRYQNDLALRFFKNILDLDPKDKAGYKHIAQFNVALQYARNSGDPSNLEAHLESETDEDRIQTGYFSLARIYEGKEDVPNALRVYKAAFEKMPSNTNLMNACAWFIYEQKASEHYAWGIEVAQKAVALEPGSASIWDTLAWLLHSDGQYQKAVDAMATCVKLEPDGEYFSQTLAQMKSDLEKNS